MAGGRGEGIENGCAKKILSNPLKFQSITLTYISKMPEGESRWIRLA